MKSKIDFAARLLLGLVFFVFGLNGLLMFTIGHGFIPTPPPPAEMMTIMTGFMATKYLMILVKLLEVVAGILLLSNQFVKLAIVLLAPIMVNILGIHLFVEHSGLPMAVILSGLFIFVIHTRWSAFSGLLTRK